MYELTELKQEWDRVFIVVRYKGLPIMKWYDPSPNPEEYDLLPDEDKLSITREDYEKQEIARAESHAQDIAVLTSWDTKAIDAIVQALGEEQVVALKNAGLCDKKGKLKVVVQKAEDAKRSDSPLLVAYEWKFKEQEIVLPDVI